MRNRFQIALASAISLHALAALGMFHYSRSLEETGVPVASVMKVNWEIDPSPVVRIQAKKAPAKTAVSILSAGQSPVQPADLSVTQSAAPPAAQTQSVLKADPTLMENYLASLRDRLGNAIHLHEPRGTASSQLVLKVAIHSSGSVSHTEIEKTSAHPDVDRAVLAAFESLLPLAPFPEEWKKSSGSLDTITVRIPVVIRARE